MIGELLGLAALIAVLGVAARRLRSRAEARRRPGATLRLPVAVTRFDEIDAAVQERVCPCGGGFTVAGETSRAIGGRRYRIARLVCTACEREEFMYFDVTLAFH